MDLAEIQHAIEELPREQQTALTAWLVERDLESAYRELAADQEREREALAWSEGVIGDVNQFDATR